MKNFYIQILVLLSFFALSSLTLNAQPWTYDFGTGSGSHIVNNAFSTTFLNDIKPTPVGGGTYRVRRGGQGGGLFVANPGTTLGSESELQIQGASGTATNKFTVFGWDNPSKIAYMKFKMRTTSSASGYIAFHLGSGLGDFYQNNVGYTTFSNSMIVLQINYTSGAISSVVRRNNGNTNITGHGFLKDANQEIEIYANNETTAVYYKKDVNYSLNARSWDLWVDGIKISPSGGFSSAGTLAGDVDLAGFGFLGENSNSANVYLDDLEYSNQLPLMCLAPTESVEGFNTFSVASENSIELEWLNGNGDGRVIVMNRNNIFTDLPYGANPTANLTYSGSGEQVVYNGTGNSPIIIDGLFPNTPYYFKGYEYCSPDKVYNNSSSGEPVTTQMGSTSIITNTTSYGSFCNGTSNVISVGFDKVGDFIAPFKVQISDELGNFPPNLNDNIIGSNSVSPISATIPANITPNQYYRVRVLNQEPITIGNDNGSSIQIFTTPTTPTTPNPATVCQGTAISITAIGSINATGYTFWDQATGGTQITTGVSGNTLTTPANLSAGTHSFFIQGENGICVSPRKEVVITLNTSPSSPSGSFIYSANPSCGPASISFDEGYYFQLTADGESIAYPTNSSYILNASGTIYVRAYNGTCWSPAVASNAITINNPINITTQPTNKTIAVNTTGILSVIASNVVTHQWQVNDGCGWENIFSANSSSLTISNPSLDKDGNQYRVLLTGGAPCVNVISNSIDLTVTDAIPISERIWFNNIDGTNPNTSDPFTSGDVANSNITVSGIGRSSGITPANANNRYNAYGWDVPDLDLNKYFTWTITANNGYNLILSSLIINLQRSGTGPAAFAIRTSQDGFVGTVTQGLIALGRFDVNMGNIRVESNESIEIRLYAAVGATPAGTLSVNDFDFKGSVTAVCTPPIIETQPHDISACYNKFKVVTSAPSPTYQWQVYDVATSSWNRILSCNEDYNGGQATQLNLLSNLSSLDGSQYRVKVSSNNCPIYSDIVTYSAAPIVINVEDLGANNLDASSCDYNGWTYYTSDDLEGRYAFAINWAPSGIISSANQNAKDDAEVIVTLDNNSFSNENVIGGIAYGTYTMKRYWNVNTISAIDEPVNVQFPYLQSEVDQIVNAAQNYLALNPSSLYENFNWFKLEGSDFTPNSSVVTPVNIMNSIPLTDVYAGQSPEGFKIAQFNNITSFSGGTGATGVGGLNNPLPVTLLYFIGNCQKDNVNLSWATATELNADKFIIQASDNGKDYFSIGEVKASGNSNTLQQYTFNTTGNFNYFQLKQVDFDGKFELSKIVVTPCNSVNDAFKAFYSTNEGFVVEMLSSTNKKVQLNITSVNGQLIYNQTKNVVKGNQIWNVSSNNLPAGIYIITVADQFDNKSTKVSVY